MCELELNFSANIRTLRLKSQLSQRELAEKLKTKRNNVSNWELGICYPNIIQLSAVARFFNLKIDDLLLNRITEGNPIYYHPQRNPIKHPSQVNLKKPSQH